MAKAIDNARKKFMEIYAKTGCPKRTSKALGYDEDQGEKWFKEWHYFQQEAYKAREKFLLDLHDELMAVIHNDETGKLLMDYCKNILPELKTVNLKDIRSREVTKPVAPINIENAYFTPETTPLKTRKANRKVIEADYEITHEEDE